MKKSYGKKILLGFVAAVIFTCTVIVLCNFYIKNGSKPYLYDNVKLIPKNKVGLLLGTAPRLSNGNRNLYFDYRIAAASTLFNTQKINYILISGDNRQQNYNEPEEMKKALLHLGVPDSAIYLDYAGLRTLDSVVRAKEVFGQDSMTIISQRFHNERAIFLANQYSIRAIGFNAKDVNTAAGFKTRIRELFARIKVFVDLTTGKEPRHLGDKISIPTRN